MCAHVSGRDGVDIHVVTGHMCLLHFALNRCRMSGKYFLELVMCWDVRENALLSDGLNARAPWPERSAEVLLTRVASLTVRTEHQGGKPSSSIVTADQSGSPRQKPAAASAAVCQKIKRSGNRASGM